MTPCTLNKSPRNLPKKELKNLNRLKSARLADLLAKHMKDGAYCNYEKKSRTYCANYHQISVLRMDCF